jgi:tetratricopeptide (TPR) repeat protein
LNISSDRSENAERLLSELIAADPDDTESRRMMADLVAEKHPEDAIKLREEASRASPGDTGDMISLAELYGRTGRKDQALSKLDEAVNLLGSRGEADDLDEMNAVLGLYENAASALESEKENLFTDRTIQLGRKLKSAMGRTDSEMRHRGQIASEEIPLDEEDALSLLDLNAMEPVIRINEEEETVYLEESAEDLEDAYTELFRPEHMGDEPGFPHGQGYAPPAQLNPSGSSDAAAQANSAPQGPPVHIHLPSQPAVPQPPQVVYQDIRPVTYQSPPPPPPGDPDPAPPPPTDTPEVSVEELTEEELPSYPESMELVLEEEDEILEDNEEMDSRALEREFQSDDEEDEEDDNHFFIPESDALSEDLPETSEPVLPDADLVFTDDDRPEEMPEEEEFEEALMLEEADDELSLVEDFDVPPPEEVPLDSDKMASMFKYLSDLTDKTTGEGRQQLIDDGVPLKLAGLHARLSGEPNLRVAAQKYDRRRQERHNIELNEDKIKESLNAFKSLAEAYPNQSVSESLSKKLGKIMSFVSRNKDSGESD